MWRKRNSFVAGGNVNEFKLFKNNMDTSQKIENRALIWLKNPTSQHLLQKPNNTTLKNNICTHGQYTIIHNSKNLEITHVLKNR